MRYVALKSARSDLRCCLPTRCCLGGSVTGIASIAVCSLSNRLSALAGVVQLTVLSLLTEDVELIELSDFIVTSGLEVDTLDLVASVNLVDLDAVVDGDFFAIIFFQCLRVCE